MLPSFIQDPASLCLCLAFKVAQELASVFLTPPQFLGPHLGWGEDPAQMPGEGTSAL